MLSIVAPFSDKFDAIIFNELVTAFKSVPVTSMNIFLSEIC